MAGRLFASAFFFPPPAGLLCVCSLLPAAPAAALFIVADGGGALSGSVVIPGSITGLEIANEAIGLINMLGDVRPPKLIAATDPQPALPSSLYPVGSTIMWMADGGRLWINRDNVSWELLVRTIDLSGK